MMQEKNHCPLPPNITCSVFLLLRLQSPGGRGGLGSPCHPVSEAPEAWHHQQRWQLSAPRAFRSARIARPQDREAQSEAWPSSLEQKDHMLGGPEPFWSC